MLPTNHPSSHHQYNDSPPQKNLRGEKRLHEDKDYIAQLFYQQIKAITRGERPSAINSFEHAANEERTAFRAALIDSFALQHSDLWV